MNRNESEMPAFWITRATYTRFFLSPFCPQLTNTLSNRCPIKTFAKEYRSPRCRAFLLFQFVIDSSRASLEYIKSRDQSKVFPFAPLAYVLVSRGNLEQVYPRLSSTLHLTRQIEQNRYFAFARDVFARSWRTRESNRCNITMKRWKKKKGKKKWRSSVSDCVRR